MRLIGLVVLIVLTVSPLVADAQQTGLRRVGLLGPGYQGAADGPQLLAFRRGLRDLGWIEGQTVAIEYRWAEGNPQRLPELARELVRLNVDVIVASSTGGIRAAKSATSTIPIVDRAGNILSTTATWHYFGTRHLPLRAAEGVESCTCGAGISRALEPIPH